jgi:ABC-type transport system involved in cytochrome c biogenesis permease component
MKHQAVLFSIAVMTRLTQRSRSRRDSAAPVLLPTFTASVGVIVLVIVLVVGRSTSDLADIAAALLLLALTGAVLFTIDRLLAEQGDDDTGEEDRR